MTCFIWYYIISFIICSFARSVAGTIANSQPHSQNRGHILCCCCDSLWFRVEDSLCRSRVVAGLLARLWTCGRKIECRKQRQKKKILKCSTLVAVRRTEFEWYVIANRRTRQIREEMKWFHATNSLPQLLLVCSCQWNPLLLCIWVYNYLCMISVVFRWIVMRRLIMDRRRPSFSFVRFSFCVCLMSFLHVPRSAAATELRSSP